MPSHAHLGGDNVRTHGHLARIAVACLLLSLPVTCLGLVLVGDNDRPVTDGGWPLGCVEVGNLPTRVLWWAGNMHQFLYRCESTDEFNEALVALAAIRAPKVELVIHDGPEYSFWLRDDENAEQSEEDTRVDFTFTVWNPAIWHSLHNDPRSFFGADRDEFRQPVPPPTLNVYLAGGPILWDDVTVPEGLVVTDKRAQAAPIKPVGGGLLRADVYDTSTGKPVAGAQIVLIKRGGETGESMVGTADDIGLCEIRKIPAGDYDITITAEGYASRKRGQYENRGDTYHALVTELSRACSIKGVVTDLAGNPIPGANVSARNTLGIDGLGYTSDDVPPATSNEQGSFEIHSLPTGFTQIRCSAPAMHCTNSIFELYQAPGEPIRLTMEGTGTVRGYVIDEYGDLPPGELHISVRPVGQQMGKWGGSARCDEDGGFEFTNVPPGDYLISADPGALVGDDTPDAQTFSLKAGEIVELEVIRKTR